MTPHILMIKASKICSLVPLLLNQEGIKLNLWVLVSCLVVRALYSIRVRT